VFPKAAPHDWKTHKDGAPPKTEVFDNTLEKTYQLYSKGLEAVFPHSFGCDYCVKKNSYIMNLMDTARDGQHDGGVPKAYDAKAYFMYSESTCKYGCQCLKY